MRVWGTIGLTRHKQKTYRFFVGRSFALLISTPCNKVLASSDLVGPYLISDDANSRFFITGHCEYDYDTLSLEYFRDKNKGLDIDVPYNYFPNDDDTKEPIVTWRSCANLLYSNWLNYFVYQTTPYDINQIQ